MLIVFGCILTGNSEIDEKLSLCSEPEINNNLPRKNSIIVTFIVMNLMQENVKYSRCNSIYFTEPVKTCGLIYMSFYLYPIWVMSGRYFVVKFGTLGA